MTGNAFTYSMPAGIPGAVNRVGGRGPDIEAQIMDPTDYLGAYGLAGQIDSATGDFRKMEAGDATIYGFLVRPYPLQATTATGYSGSVPLGTAGVPPQSGVIDVLKSGYMTVLLRNATAAVKNGVVYIRVANPTADLPLGGAEAADDGADTIAVNAYFMGGADANGNVEIAFNIN